MMMTNQDWKEWNIPAGNEHRFEVPFENNNSNSFTFKLEEGTAEIYGSELAAHREYSVSGCKLAIFSFTGAKILYRGGPCSVEYLSSEPAVAQEALLNLQVALEGHFQRTGRVPRVLLLGTGRNTVGRTLINYATRRIEDDALLRPILVDLDVANGTVCLPGSLTAVAPNRPLEIVQDASAAFHSQQQAGLVSLFYGSTVLADNPKVYLRLCERMGELVEKRCKFASMVLVIAPSDVTNSTGTSTSSTSSSSASAPNANIQLLDSLKRSFSIDHIVVIGNERLHVTISKHITDPTVTVLKIPRAGGVVSKDAAFRRDAQARAFKSYFYGAKMEFHPFSLVVSFGQVVIYRVGDASSLAPSSALPLGATRKIDATKLTKVSLLSSAQLLYSILAIVKNPKEETDEFEDALDAPLLGFLHVIDVDEANETFTVSSPCPGALPSKFLLSSSLKWIEK